MEEFDPSQFSKVTFKEKDSGSTLEFAGFWRRLAAGIIDNFIFLVLSGVLFLILSLVLGASIDPGPFINAIFRGDLNSAWMATKGPALDLLIFSSLGTAIFFWLYFAGFESSIRQATPGKRFLRIMVTDMAGNRISFGAATGRCIGKFFSAAILCIGFIMIAFTNHKQGLHDKIAATLVVRKPSY